MRALQAVALALLVPSVLFAQAQYGSIGGAVKDSTGAVIPGVAISIVHSETGQAARGVSAEDGRYLVPQLLPGTYEIRVEHTGFKGLSITGITLNINQNIERDLTLEVGAVAETISVSSRAQFLETVTGSIGHVVDNKEIDELPLNGRNVFDLINLTPGSFRNGADVLIGGGRANSAAALLDGVSNSRGGIGEQNIEIDPPVDTMQEFRVETNAYSAQYGRSSAGIVNAVTKGGTNAFRGAIYEFLRNDKLDSRGWNADVKAPLRRNQFGGTVGGPIFKNRTFFFYGLDLFLERRGVVRTRTVPLAEWRQGDLSRVTRQVSSASGPIAQPLVIYDPLTGQRTPFPNNIIPSARFDPVAQKAISYVPLPNRPPDNPITQGGNWQENSSDPTDKYTHTARIDHSFNERTKLFGRYILVSPDKNDTGGTAGYGVADTDALSLRNRRQNLALNLTRVFSPRTFATFRGGVGRVYIRRSGVSLGGDWPNKLGIKGVMPDVFPRFNVPGGTVTVSNFGSPGNHNRRASLTNSEGHTDFTMMRGDHSLKFGGSYIRFNANEQSRQFASGQFIFNVRYTNGINASGNNIANTGMTFADFLLGRPNQVNAEFSQGNSRRSQYYGAYFEDAWKLRPNFTLTVGVRYELESPFYEVNNRMNNFDPWVPNPAGGTGDIPAGVRGIVTFPERNGYGKRLVEWDPNNLAPRFGFNWRPFSSSSTVVRGGFGIFFGNPYDRNVFQSMGLGFDARGTYRDPVPFTLSQGLPPGSMVAPSPADLTPTFGTRGSKFAESQVQFLDPHRKTQYSENFNLTIQRQWRGLFFETGYLGNLGRKVIFGNINLNMVPPELLSRTDIAIRLRRPYPQFDSDAPQIQIIAPNWGLSNYHAFNSKFERRFSNGFGWVAIYTWSKKIDNVTGIGTALGDDDQVQCIYDLKHERSLSSNHIPHRAVFSPIVELPFGKGKKWLKSGPLNWMAGGWQVSGIVTLQAGAPFGVQVTNGPRDILGDNANSTNLRANIIGDISLPADQKGTPAVGQRGIQWFNPDAFAPPARFTYGNSARSIMLGPGRVNFDTAISRNIRVRERYRLQFRWEAFNAFNTPVFGLPGSNLGGGGFGIATASGVREIQFALKLYY